MARLLNDVDLGRALGSIIMDGSKENIRSNSYVLRLGRHGEFLNTSKEFELGQDKKGIKIPPGHAVAITALETLDFRRDVVHRLFPKCDLHAFVTPTTDMSREGIVAPSTQVDAGYHGTLNWTLTNTARGERAFTYGERVYRMTIWLLEEGETPEQLYEGDYQGQEGYVRSKRRGPPAGMRETEWAHAYQKGGPEDMLEELINSGYPWNLLGTRFKQIDQDLKTVTNEYGEIYDALESLKREQMTENKVRRVVREESASLQNRWLVASMTGIGALVGLGLTVITNDYTRKFTDQHGTMIGLIILVACVAGLLWISRQK